MLPVDNLCEDMCRPFELVMLSEISDEFLAYGLSSVDVSSGIIKGRHYGGTAILYRKQYARIISVVNSCEPRLCAIRVVTCKGPIMIANVYMLTDNNEYEAYDEYVCMCTMIHSIFLIVYFLVVAGDLNCKLDSKFYDVSVNL